MSPGLNLAGLASDYERERAHYERLAVELREAIHECLLDAGVPHTISSRVKEYASLARKAVKKGWPDPMHRSPDLAGIRVIVPLSRLKGPIVDALQKRFVVTGDDDKVTGYGVNEFRYLGRHMQISFRPDDERDPSVASREAELQLHTRAESAWADASHDLTYKAALELPDRLQRSVNRLLALVELFDGEMGRAQDELLALPAFPAARMLQTLERVFLPLARQEYDRDLSTHVLSAISRLYTASELDGYDVLIGQFLATASPKLQTLYERWAKDQYANPLVLQPEAIAVFERLDRDPTGLRDAWDEQLPPDLLDQLAGLWGVVLSRPGEHD